MPAPSHAATRPFRIGSGKAFESRRRCVRWRGVSIPMSSGAAFETDGLCIRVTLNSTASLTAKTRHLRHKALIGYDCHTVQGWSRDQVGTAARRAAAPTRDEVVAIKRGAPPSGDGAHDAYA